MSLLNPQATKNQMPLHLAQRPAALHDSPEEYFQQRLEQIVCPGDRILDAGCGAGKFSRMDFAKEIGCHLTGVDLQEALGRNQQMDSRVRADLKRLPFSDKSFDVVNCRLVIEHLDAPQAALEEFHRVLAPGGRLAIFTPNLLHYFGAAATLTPHWFHIWFNRRVRGFDDSDIFPTYYRANTRRRLRALLLKSGFARADVTLVEGAPSVLAFNSLLHRVGIGYERLVKRFDLLSAFRLNIIAIAHKG
jgi:ubiquinone/menaquinone biosynthesis C-methylase UbiE